MKETFKWLLPRLPLPMLALAASYGVYQFALLFVPWWVALIQAAAFETTYLGLATIESETPEQRRRATAISVGAVVVSVMYNSLAGFLHRNGLGELPIWGEVVLATLHGAPLAIVAYLVADLLLHKGAAVSATTPAPAIEAPLPTPLPKPIEKPLPAPAPQPLPEPEPVAEPDIEFSPVPVDEPVADSSLLDWLIDDQPVTNEPEQEEQAGSGLSLRAQIYAILSKRGNLENAELYALLPGTSQSSIRVHAGDWRNDVPLKKQKTASVNGNGKHPS